MDKDGIKNAFSVGHNVRDPAGTGLRGVAPGYDLTSGALGHPQLLWILPNGGDVFFEGDVYAQPGQPMVLYINCPLCLAHGRKIQLRIVQDQKQFSYDVERTPRPFPGWSPARMQHEIVRVFGEQNRVVPTNLGGVLTIADPIRCTFEADPSLRRSVDAICSWKVRVTENVVRSA